jgi:hypothetical protein
MTTLHAHSKLRPGVSAPQTVLAARRIRFDVADMVDVKAVHASFAVLARVHFDVRCLQAQGACKLEYLAAKPRKLLDELLAESYLFIRARALRAPDSLELIKKRSNHGSVTASPLKRHRSLGLTDRRASDSSHSILSRYSEGASKGARVASRSGVHRRRGCARNGLASNR